MLFLAAASITVAVRIARRDPGGNQYHLQSLVAAPGRESVLAVLMEVARTLPVELLRLMGYQRGACALGYVGDLLDPIQVVRPDIQNGLGDSGGHHRS